MDKTTMIAQRVAFGKALAEVGAEFEKLVVFDADVGASTQTKYFKDAYPDRFYQCGIAEANMVGMAAGLSTTGWVPFVSTFAVFLAKRAADQVRVSVAYPALNVKLNGSYAGLPTGKAGATHSSVEDIAVMRAMPNMKVLDPADPVEIRSAVILALKTPGPVYVRSVRCPVPVIFPESHVMELGKGIELHAGEDIAVISSGMMTPKALEAVEMLEKEGLHARLIHMGTIKPLDQEIVVKAARDCGHIVTVENHSVIGGLGGAVAETLCDLYPCRLTRIGFPDIFMDSGDDEEIFTFLGMNPPEIAAKVRSLVKRSKL